MDTLSLNRGKREDRPKRRRSLEDSQGFGRLTVNGIEDDKEYYYHVVNDKNNRVWQLQQRGYEIVEQKEGLVMGDYNPSEVGSQVSAIADKKDGTKAVLMRIPRDWKEEDDKFRQSEIDKTERALFRTLKEEGQYGEIKKENS